MCRHAAYIGPPLALGAFLLGHEHSLVVQSYAAREFVGRALVSADGYGVGWLAPDGEPSRYRSVAPVWQDPNLPDLARSVRSGLWVANVRSATPPLPVSHENTHPFTADGLLFSHNGYVEGFVPRVRLAMRRALSPEAEEGIRGGTDSEHLFALLRQRLAAGADGLAAAARGAVGDLAGMLPGSAKAFLSLIAARQGEVVAVRHALGGGACPSLYVAEGHPSFPGGMLAASEPFDGDSSWEPVPEGGVARLAEGSGGIEVEAGGL